MMSPVDEPDVEFGQIPAGDPVFDKPSSG